MAFIVTRSVECQKNNIKLNKLKMNKMCPKLQVSNSVSFQVAKYDMVTQERIFEGTPLSHYGYSRVCGDCTEYCAFAPGEESEHVVNDFITTCFDHRKIKPRP